MCLRTGLSTSAFTRLFRVDPHDFDVRTRAEDVQQAVGGVEPAAHAVVRRLSHHVIVETEPPGDPLTIVPVLVFENFVQGEAARRVFVDPGSHDLIDFLPGNGSARHTANVLTVGACPGS